MKEIEVTVSGKVHGVMYRDFVARRARGLWLSGYVENIPGYSVRVVAQGSEEKLNTLIEYLWKGPFLARVSDVSVLWREARDQYIDFSIRH